MRTHRHRPALCFATFWVDGMPFSPSIQKIRGIYDDNELTVAEFGVETGYGALGFTEIEDFTDVDGLVFGPYIGDLAILPHASVC